MWAWFNCLREESIGLSVSGEEAKIDFQDGRHGGHIVFPTNHPDAAYQVKPIGLLVQEKKPNINFQDGGHGSHPGFLIGVVLATFIYKSP